MVDIRALMYVLCEEAGNGIARGVRFGVFDPLRASRSVGIWDGVAGVE
jgi:hypothetical protein